MCQNQKEQANMKSYKTTTELVNEIKKDDCFNSYTIGALRLMYSSTLNTKLSWLDIVAGFIHAYEAAQQFNNPHMSVQKCV